MRKRTSCVEAAKKVYDYLKKHKKAAKMDLVNDLHLSWEVVTKVLSLFEYVGVVSIDAAPKKMIVELVEKEVTEG